MKTRCASTDSKASRQTHNWKLRFRVPSIDFTFKTDPLETSKCDFAVMGTEVNGKYYEATEELNVAEQRRMGRWRAIHTVSSIIRQPACGHSPSSYEVTHTRV